MFTLNHKVPSGHWLYLALVCLALLSPAPAYAQAHQDPVTSTPTHLTCLYANLGAIYSGSVGPSAGLNIIFSNRIGGSFSFTYHEVKTENQPSDYIGNDQMDEIRIYSLRFMYEFPTSRKSIRFGIEAGPSLVEFDEAIFYFTPQLWFSNYSVSSIRSKSAGFSLRPKAEFALSQTFGFEAAINFNANKYQTILGGELLFTIGRVRERIKPPSE